MPVSGSSRTACSVVSVTRLSVSAGDGGRYRQPVARERSALGYQPALDGLRAVAIALVLGYHILDWPHAGYLGVDLFFVLSGFLITTLLLEEWWRYRSISFGRFYLRRALRLFPALWVMLAATLIVYPALGSAIASQLKGVLQGLTYTTNLGVLVGHWDTRFGYLWSLSVEEQFYLVWPLVLFLLLRSRRVSLRAMGIGVAAAATAIMLGRYAATPSHITLSAGGCRHGDCDVSVTRFDSVLVGCSAALLYASVWGGWLRRVAGSPFAVAIALAAAAWLAITGSGQYAVYDGVTFFFSVATAFLLVAAVRHLESPGWTRWLRGPLTIAPVVFLGRISYAVYLWHVPIWFWGYQRLNVRIGSTGAQIVVIAGTLAVATASYYLVERWFLRQKWRLARTTTHDADVAPTLTQRPEPSEVAVVRQ
jgi:peptidoglycan/LPS O-acetylase OafA/YrhL